MRDNLKPVLKVLYCPIKKDWNERITAELKKRGLTLDDLDKFCVFAIPEGASGAYYDNLN